VGTLCSDTHPGAYSGQDAYTGRLVPVAFDTTQITSVTNCSNPQPGDPYHTLHKGDAPAIAFEARYVRNGRGAPSEDVFPPLKAQSGETGKGDAAPLVAMLETLQPIAYNGDGGDADASTQEANAREVLRTLQHEVGEKAFAEWGFGVLDSLQSPEVLRSALHGVGVRRAASEARFWMDDSSLPRAESLSTGTMRQLWKNGPDGRSPQGRQLAQQLAMQLGKALPFMPHQAPSYVVRRLTPRETERLQGFPDDWTAIPWRGKPADQCPDGPRYKSCGNSMAVPVIRWLAQRIEATR